MKGALDGQVALVTGAATGLGAAISRCLHVAGCRVGISDIDLPAAQAFAAQLDDSGATAMALALDVREPAAFGDARDHLVERWGRVEILVNNAVITAAKPVLDILPQDFNDVVATNLGGTFAGCQTFGRYFRDRGYGRIVNIASLAGQNGGTATGAHYAASKGGIITLTKIFARDLASFGVTTNAVAPGPLDLPSVRALVPPDRLDAIIESIPVGRLGDPDFIAATVVHLASPAAASVNGAIWDINGGLLMR